MNIYVQSRGYYQPEQDYRWLKAAEDGQISPEIPPLSKTAINLIAEGSSSIILERLPARKLLLMITGIEPYKIQEQIDSITGQINLKKIPREDSEPRQIVIDVTWIEEDNPRTDYFFRKMVAFALQDENRASLTEKIDQSVLFLKDIPPEQLTETQNNQSGFYPCFDELSQLIFTENLETIPESKSPHLIPKIGKNIPDLRNELSREISECYLPSEPDILVVVTGFKKRETLEKAGVWRALSELVNQEHWEEVEISQEDDNLSGIDFKKLLLLPINLLTPVLKILKQFIKSILLLSEDACESDSSEQSNPKKPEK